MTNPNPFAAPAPQQAPPAPQPAPAPMPQQPNPFGAGVPATTAPPSPYGQPAPQQAPPAPAPQAAPAPQGYAAPAPQQQAYTAPLDVNRLGSVGAPPPAGAGGGAKLADMYDRLVLVFPHACDTVPRNPQYITAEQRAQGRLTEERVTATIVVLDMGPGTSPAGGYIDFGGAPHEFPPTPHTTRENLPYVRKAMWIAQSRLVAQLKPFLPNGMCAGRVTKAGPDRNSPWYLAEATEADLDLCRKYMEGVGTGYFPHPLA